MSKTILERLRSQHNDLRQGAYYSPRKDPTWDATSDAADEIERLNRAVEALIPFASLDGRYVVRCDDDSIIATDEPMDGDDVIYDRGEGW